VFEELHDYRAVLLMILFVEVNPVLEGVAVFTVFLGCLATFFLPQLHPILVNLIFFENK
jgi:hypothetical protein